MKKVYLDIMEAALRSYTEEHIKSYFETVRRDGLAEHGFPRLCANLGVLIANGRCAEYTALFSEMMDFCCEQMPGGKAGNDFSVKEIAFAILELQAHRTFPPEEIDRWKGGLASVDPFYCYSVIAPSPDVPVNNWAAYNAASEFMRQVLGLCDAGEFLNRQIPSQLLSFDENGMYRDPDEPMLYDLATRCQLAVLLYFGYDGKYEDQMSLLLQRSGLLTMQMQSVSGEIPFGGRSNQFLFNEAYLAAILEFGARTAEDKETAGRFKRAARLAAESILRCINGRQLRHVKNRWPQESMFGCESYAYFDKYMISLASFIYLAFLFADDSVGELPCPAETGGFTAQTSKHFHKYFINCAGWFLEYDTSADPHYDASGLGRIHKRGSLSELCLSVPFSAHPSYQIAQQNPSQLSLCAIAVHEGQNVSCADSGTVYRLIGEKIENDAIEARFAVSPCEGLELQETCRVSQESVILTVCGAEKLSRAVPVFDFNGEEHTEISAAKQEIVVRFQDHGCRFTTDGYFDDRYTNYSNRNGVYRCYLAHGTDRVSVKIEMW